MPIKKKKISSILPAEILSEAVRLTGVNQTDAIVMALKELIRSYKRTSILDLKGRIKINFNADIDRERKRF